MNGTRKPDYDVVIVRTFTRSDGKQGSKWFKIGSAWQNTNDINMDLFTMPGVSIKLVPQEKMKEKFDPAPSKQEVPF